MHNGICNDCVSFILKGIKSRGTPVPSRMRTFVKADLPLPVRIYRKACKRLRILPLRRVLGQFGRPRIILNDLCMSFADVRAACRGLMVGKVCSLFDKKKQQLNQILKHKQSTRAISYQLETRNYTLTVF